MKKDISASEAAGILGVSLATLYSYVSRGLLRSAKTSHTRSKVYELDEVLRLAARRSDAKHGGHQAQSAISWGVPLLETHISHILHGQLYYRGHLVQDLAQSSTLERVASLLWGDTGQDYFMTDHVPMLTSFKHDFPLPQADTTPMRRVMAAIPFFSMHYQECLEKSGHDSKQDLAFAAYLLRQITTLLLDSEATNQAIHLQIALAWECDAIEADLIRRSLILLADHELNASTFAVRCVASTGADVSLSLSAGIAAYCGYKHGGGSDLVQEFLNGASHAASIADYVQAFFSNRDPSLTGFGHTLYPQGDPRAAELLRQLQTLATSHPRLQQGLSFCLQASHQLQLAPNMDCMLALMTWAFCWPEFAASILFVTARSAAWISHAYEQQASEILIRPRARYIGNYHSN